MKIIVLFLSLLMLSKSFSQEPPIVVSDECIDFPEIMAHYPGGEEAMNEFLLKNLRYPQEALENGEQGKVFLEFIVEKDGSLTNIQIMRSVSQELDKEAKRLIQAMPNWIPGEMSGEKKRTRVRLPVIFVLR